MTQKQIAEDIQTAVQTIRQGGIILYPTDTIWGIGCDASNEEAVKRIFQLKRREDSKAMICLVDSADRMQRYLRQVPDVAWDLVEFAEKPLTLILDGASGLAPNLIAEDGSIGLRVTNVSGEPSPACFAEISDEIKQGVDYIMQSRQNDTSKSKPSQIIKLNLDGRIQIIRK